MVSYEYQCRECDMQHLFPSPQPPGTPCKRDGCDGTLKRIWSVGVVWPADERGH